MRVLLVDDHRVVLVGLRRLLSTYDDVTVVGAAEDGANAVRLAMDTRPDVVLMDVRMTGVDGIDATRTIKRLVPGCAVVMLTSSDVYDDIAASLDAGADGYLLKDTDPDLLVDALRRCLAGEVPLSPTVQRQLGGPGPGAEPWPGRPADLELTRRETQILRLIAEGRSNQDIADTLGISDKTVKSHCSNLFARIEVTSRTQAAMWAARHLDSDAPRRSASAVRRRNIA